MNNKYDFVVLFSVDKANPNGDPLNGNRPRVDSLGFGEVSDVALKRKLRNRLQDMGERIFVQSDERSDDGFKSLSERASDKLKGISNSEEYAKKACETWFDVRSFGQVFAFKPTDKKDKGVSVGVRGPVSIFPAFSVTEIEIQETQITKSVNSEPSEKKSSDTMGMKYRTNFGVYMTKGSINVQLAEKTGFSDDDAQKIHEALKTLFDNDASSARPEGSMIVEKVFWWKHNNKSGQYSSGKVHGSVEVKLKSGITSPTSFSDYEVTLHELDGLHAEVYSA